MRSTEFRGDGGIDAILAPSIQLQLDVGPAIHLHQIGPGPDWPTLHGLGSHDPCDSNALSFYQDRKKRRQRRERPEPHRYSDFLPARPVGSVSRPGLYNLGYADVASQQRGPAEHDPA